MRRQDQEIQEPKDKRIRGWGNESPVPGQPRVRVGSKVRSAVRTDQCLR